MRGTKLITLLCAAIFKKKKNKKKKGEKRDKKDEIGESDTRPCKFCERSFRGRVCRFLGTVHRDEWESNESLHECMVCTLVMRRPKFETLHGCMEMDSKFLCKVHNHYFTSFVNTFLFRSLLAVKFELKLLICNQMALARLYSTLLLLLTTTTIHLQQHNNITYITAIIYSVVHYSKFIVK